MIRSQFLNLKQKVMRVTEHELFKMTSHTDQL